ncbi:hypothetical protein MMC20_003846 [Loxospora ochrophaea]|nr:hypothetical protein [Loxospora ochrophaea]
MEPISATLNHEPSNGLGEPPVSIAIMAQSIPDQVIGSPEATTPTDAHSAALPLDPPPRLKGRKRILQSLQKMSSSPSLAKLGRGPSSAYRSGGKGSMSCVSLSSSASPYTYSYGNSYSSQSSAGFSTAPTSGVSTPAPDALILDTKARIRIIDGDNGVAAIASPTSVPLPLELRPASKGTHLPATPEITEVLGDYFSKPSMPAKALPKRRNFDFWGEMPYEIKVHIFQFLKPKQIVRCSSVSKSWHKMCFDGQLWVNLDATEFYQDIPSDSLVKIMTAAGPFVRDLNLRGCVQMRDRWSSDGHKITDACRNLVNFSIEGCRIDRSSVHYFLLRNPRLVHINLSGVSVLNNSAMKIIAQGCPQLEHLNVSWCQHIDTRGLHKVVQACQKLKDLRAVEIKGFNDKEFLLDLFNRNTLERLILSHCTDLSDESLQLLIQGENPEIDPLTEKAIVPPRAFRHLDFSRCKSLTDKGMKCLAYNAPHLAGLQLSQCHGLTDDALTGILESTPLLTHLDLEELDELSNTTLLTLSKAPCASTLEHLSISYCENLGDTGMLEVVKKCPKLKNLDMDNTGISDLVLTEAAAQVRHRNRTVATGNASGRPEIGLHMVVYDCQHVNWTGVREVLSRNAEIYRAPPSRRDSMSSPPKYPSRIISMKCFYGYQPTVDEHTKRVLRGDLTSANRLERKWAEYMIASEEAGAQGAGARRRRRRAREAALVHADEEDGAGRGGRRRARSGGCVVM